MKLAPPGQTGNTTVRLKELIPEIRPPGMGMLGRAPWNRGLRLDPAYRAKISASLKDRDQPWDHANHCTPHTEETRQIIREIKLGLRAPMTHEEKLERRRQRRT